MISIRPVSIPLIVVVAMILLPIFVAARGTEIEVAPATLLTQDQTESPGLRSAAHDAEVLNSENPEGAPQPDLRISDPGEDAEAVFPLANAVTVAKKEAAAVVPLADAVTVVKKEAAAVVPLANAVTVATKEAAAVVPLASAVTVATKEEAAVVPLANAVTVATGDATSLRLLGADVLPGTYQRLSWTATELFEGVPVSTPVLVVNGKSPGPTLCLTAAVHGDELNGIEMVRRVLHDINPSKLSGAVIGVPIVNLQGFRRASRYLPDRRDLNRYFPGNPNGSAASRIAHSFFTEIAMHCDALVDLHTGSFERANLPQLRADLRNPDVVTLTEGFGATVILHSDPSPGTLRHAATAAGIPAVTIEAGGPSVLELAEVKHGVKGIQTLLNALGMVRKVRLWGDPEPVYYRSTWVRANSGGILLADVSLGSTVRKGDLLGTITDPMNNASAAIYSPFAGRIIGMARNQVVMPGFAAFHVGIQSTEPLEMNPAETDSLSHEEAETNRDYIDGMSE